MGKGSVIIRTPALARSGRIEPDLLLTASALAAAGASSLAFLLALAPHWWLIPIASVSAISNCVALKIVIGRSLAQAIERSKEVALYPEVAAGRTLGFTLLLLASVTGYVLLTVAAVLASRRIHQLGILAGASVVVGFPTGHAAAFVLVALDVRRVEDRIGLLVWNSSHYWRGGAAWGNVARAGRRSPSDV